MSEVIFDISVEGVVRISGFPPERADEANLLARGLTGYFRANGLVGPEHAQQRLDHFNVLLDKYGIDKTGMVAGVVQ